MQVPQRLVASGESRFSSWDQVAIRNLIPESVLGRETKGAVTRRNDLGIQADELTSLLAESQKTPHSKER
jgi:hypothetical protein